MLSEYNKHGNKQRYICGHTPNQRWPSDTPPINIKGIASTKKAVANRRSKWARKMAVLRHYSGGTVECICCGENNPMFLAIDHIDGKGNEHRKELGVVGGYSFYLWLIQNDFPTGYRVLCHNCNMATGILGYCPHRPPQEVLDQEAAWEQVELQKAEDSKKRIP